MKKAGVTQLTDTKLIEAFRHNFPRVIFKGDEYVEISSEEPDYVTEWGAIVSADGRVLRLNDYPFIAALRLEPNFRLKELIPDLNQVILFRTLQLIAGKYDITYLAIHTGTGLPLAWSYSFTLAPTLVATVESQGSRVDVILFKRDGEATLSQDERDALAGFLRSLKALHDNNSRFFDEGAFIKQANVQVSYVNLFREKYQGGELLLRMAVDKQITETLGDWNLNALLESGKESHSNGFLLVSSALFFFMSLEALVNLAYAMLLKQSVRSNDLLVSLIKKDLHLRLSGIHLFCENFATPPFPSDSKLLERVMEFQTWRNKVVHADLSDDLRLYSALESGVLLHYFPAVDNRGFNKSKKHGASISRFQPIVRAADVRNMKAIVDAAKEAIAVSLAPDAAMSFAEAMDRPAIGGAA